MSSQKKKHFHPQGRLRQLTRLAVLHFQKGSQRQK
nr:MAG TPA: hypothetical protein [Caudoviricetes sp.]